MPTISFIGYGNMAKAIAKGLMQNNQYQLVAASPSLSECVLETITTTASNLKASEGADIIILAVKPYQMAEVLQEIRPVLGQNTLLISVAAGVSLKSLANNTSAKQAIIRCMPNTPSAVGEGMSALIGNRYVSDIQKQQAENIFQSVGLVQWLDDEQQMHLVTALSGSGPAYVFRIMEAMITAASELGLPEPMAEKLCRQTFKGALKLLETSSLNLEQLRQSVTSPNGTTAAALETLGKEQLDKVLLKTIDAARIRSIELAEKF